MNIDDLVLKPASTISSKVDATMLVLLSICGATLFIIFFLMLAFGIRYRKGSSHSRELQKTESLILEWGWTIVTLIVFIFLFIYGTVIYFKMHIAPIGAMEVNVVGKQWMWKFQHPNGQREINEFHLPVGQPILLKMISQDVIHSFFVPGFRIKQDVLPGRYTEMWFEASRIGNYHLFCTQYCGTMHAQMLGQIFVLSQNDYEKWLEGKFLSTLPPISSASRGEELFKKFGCIACHNESGKIGPSLEGLLFDSKVELSTGEVILADEDYIRESILYPNKKVVKGYEPIMPSYLGKISEEEILDLVSYIKSLGVSNKIPKS